MNARTVGAALCLLPALLGAQTTLHLPQPPNQLSATGRVLASEIKRHIDAGMAGNRVEWSRFVDSNYAGIEDTTVFSFKSVIAHIAADTGNKLRSPTIDIDNIRIYEHGDLAILTYDGTEKTHYGEQTVSSTSRVSTTFQSRGGHWYLVFANVTSFPIETVASAGDTSRYDSYVGKYDWGGEYNVVVSRDGSRLVAVQTGDTTHDEMFPDGGDRFFEKDDAGTLLFARDAAGKVTELIYHGPGRTTIIARKVS